MNAINPSLSAALSLQPQQNQMNAKPELRMDDKSSSQSTNGGNSTVTISDAAQAISNGQNELMASQTVRSNASIETNTTEANQTTSGLTYGNSLQNKASFYSAVANLGSSE